MNPKEKFTHLAKIYGIECYFNENTNELKGTNWFNNLLIDFFIWLDITFDFNEYFAIELIKKL